MKFITSIVILLAIIYESQGCEPVELPEYGEMSCYWLRNGVQQCRFKCNNLTEMVGRDTLTCRDEAENWNRPVPVCSPITTKCSKKNKKNCPKVSRKMLANARGHRRSLAPEQLEAIRQTKQAYRNRHIRRSTRKCYSWMCLNKCVLLGPSRHLVNRCIRCKNTVLKCKTRSSSVFGY